MSGESQPMICTNCGARLARDPRSTRATIRCACGQEMPVLPGGGRAARASSSSLAVAAQLYAGRIPHSRYTEEAAEPGRSWLQIGIGAAVMCVAAAAILWFATRPKHGLPGPLAGDDVQILQYIDDHPATEVRKWFQTNPSRILGGMTPNQASRFVDDVYGMGVKRILAFGAYMTMAVVLELPDDPEQRKVLFEWSRKYGSMFDQPVKDVGQRYMFVKLGL